MRTRSMKKILFRTGIMAILLLMLIAESGVALAIGGQVLSVDIAFDQTLASIGQTPLLSIDISNTGDQPVVVNSLVCTSFGNSLTNNSINPVPSTIPAHSVFHTHQLYRANAAGVTQVTCALSGVGKFSNTGIGATSSAAGVNVLPDNGLYIYATSGTHVATVGQAIYIDITVGNRSKTPFKITDLSCSQTGPGILLELQTVAPSNTLSAGQIDFVQYRGFATSPGVLGFQCVISATDSNGTAVKRFAPVINITVK